MNAPVCLAIDLGAESGRVIAGTFHDRSLQIAEVHRFPNGGVPLNGHLYWDVLRLWEEIQNGLRHAKSHLGAKSISSIGLDTWGVDYGLLDANDTLIQNPHHYRDTRTDNIMAELFQMVPAEDVFFQTGIQLMQINSLCQLFSMVHSGSPALSIANTFLNTPDLFNFFLTGEKANELSIVSTTQCYSHADKTWANSMLSTLQIPTHIFGEIIPSGTVLGPIRAPLANQLGLEDVRVVASTGHDTASAVAAVPAVSEDFIYLSSGTWSLMGVELDEPQISRESLLANMTNEIGYGGKIRFLRNIVGLWILQECRREWSLAGRNYDYATLIRMAEAAPAFGGLINPEEERFFSPTRMVEKIQAYCHETGQQIPTGKGAIVRCILESLAMEYRWFTEQIDRMTGIVHPIIYIISGGAKNQLLNQFTANATGKQVLAGLEEATAIGNIIVQAIALGEIGSLAEGRQIVRESFPMATYHPQETGAWEEAYQRYQKLKTR